MAPPGTTLMPPLNRLPSDGFKCIIRAGGVLGEFVVADTCGTTERVSSQGSLALRRLNETSPNWDVRTRNFRSVASRVESPKGVRFNQGIKANAVQGLYPVGRGSGRVSET
jgi:hypothetical protein